jgi:transcriptional regulator GlxA family with amidase domain
MPGRPDNPRRERPSTRRARADILDQATRIVATDFARPLALAEIAERVAVSPRHLQRAFRELDGIGYRAYLRCVRMSHARELLTTTGLSVNEVARRVGYRDPSQFAKTFRRTYGMSPSELRSAPDVSGRVAPSPSS